MKLSRELSRRKFILNAASGSIGTLGAAGLLTSCIGSNTKTDELTDDKGLKSGFILRPEVKVTDLWVNRMIGDQQPEIPKKYTYTTQAFYQVNSPLLPSGLLGPVKIVGLSAN